MNPAGLQTTPTGGGAGMRAINSAAAGVGGGGGSNNLKRERQRVCAVCEDDSDGLHFGQPTCRACAAFFRRSVSQRLQYICKREGHCEIDRGARNACRSCRYKKCLEQGMLPTAVQNVGTPNSSKATSDLLGDERNLPPALTSPPLGHGGGPTSAFQPHHNQQQLQQFGQGPNSSASSSASLLFEQMSGHGNFMMLDCSPVIGPPPAKRGSPNCTTAICTSTTSAGSDGPPQFKHLGRMLDGYHQFLSLRKASYAMVHDDLSMSHLSGDQLMPSHFDNYKKLCKIGASLMFDTIERFFWPFGDVCLDDKRKMFKPFSSTFCNANRAFITSKRFGPGDDRLIMPDGGYVKLSQLHLFFKDSKRVTGDPEQVARIFHNAIQYLITNVVAHMRNIDIQETELLAMAGMFLWADSAELTVTTLQLAQQVRNEIIIDLHNYYHSLGHSNEEITLKTANLFLLIPKLDTVVKMMIEDASISDLFNMLTIEESCKGHVLV